MAFVPIEVTQNHYYAQTLNKLRATAQQLKTIQDQPLSTWSARPVDLRRIG